MMSRQRSLRPLFRTRTNSCVRTQFIERKINSGAGAGIATIVRVVLREVRIMAPGGGARMVVPHSKAHTDYGGEQHCNLYGLHKSTWRTQKDAKNSFPLDGSDFGRVQTALPIALNTDADRRNSLPLDRQT